jgi:hypothetical protein
MDHCSGAVLVHGEEVWRGVSGGDCSHLKCTIEVLNLQLALKIYMTNHFKTFHLK